MQPPLSTSSTKRPLMWPTFLDQKHFVIAFNDPKPAGYAALKNWNYALKLKIDTPKINWGIKYFIRSLSWKFELNQARNRFFKIKQSFGKKTECTVFCIFVNSPWCLIDRLLFPFWSFHPWSYLTLFRGHCKSSQKSTKRAKIRFTWNSFPPPETNKNSHFTHGLQLSDQCVYKTPFNHDHEAWSALFSKTPTLRNE